MSAHARHLLRTLAIALAVAGTGVLVVTLDASAYVTGHGTASARATVTTLPAPAITRTSTGAGSVTLTWSAVTAPSSGTVTYYVTRDGGTPAGSCPASSRPAAVTTCTDTGLTTGSHAYTVTAVWRTWTATSGSANATVAFGPATQLVFTTQPAGATGGTAFTTQPVVTARDANGVTVTDYSGSVALAIVSGTGTSGAALSGCRGTLANGVTSFSGCAIDKAGSNYRLRARDGTLSVDSAAFNVTAGAVARLVFTTQPGGGATGGTAFPTQPVVTAQDAGGNRVTSFSATITLSVLSGTGAAGAALTGCSGSTSNGVATFSNCEIDKAGTGYVLHASANSGAVTGDSAAFEVAVGSVSQLAFTTQPGGGATGGTAFPTQPVVTAQDAGGNTVTSYTRAITLTIQSGARNAVLSGCSATTTGGVASFGGCTLDLADTAYKLRASDGSRNVTSAQFAVSVGALAQFEWTTSPGSSTAGTAFSNQPVVQAEDAGGNAITGYAGTVALAIRSGPAGATLSGCAIARRSSGVTTFSGCKLDKSGTYVLVASDGAATGDSTSFTVSAAGVSTLAFTTQPAGAVAGSVFTTQPVVTAFDAFGNVATSYTSSVSLSIKSGTGTGGTLSGCNTPRASSGVATFSGCKISRSGSGLGYVLRASDGTRTADSSAFNVTG